MSNSKLETSYTYTLEASVKLEVDEGKIGMLLKEAITPMITAILNKEIRVNTGTTGSYLV